MDNDKIIYLDNGDTTRIDPLVLTEMNKIYEGDYGNPASLHQLGINADNLLIEQRQKLAHYINASPQEVIFCSGATEANNLAIYGVAHARKKHGKHILISTIEHSSVLEVVKKLAAQGFEYDLVKVDKEGFLDIDDLKLKIRKDTILASVIYASYEIGTIQNIEEIGRVCRDKGVLFHTDAAQAFGKLKIDVQAENIDLLTINAHKMHGPKGIGALYVKKGVNLARLLEGGAHEQNKRPGTENLPAIVGFVKAAEIAYNELDEANARISNLRNKLVLGLKEIDHIFYNGPKTDKHRLPNNADITFQYIEGEAILMHLSLRGICVSSGSACSSKTLEPSHVLTAIGLVHEQAHGSIRFTLSKYTTEDEIDYTIKTLKEVVAILRSMSSFVPEKHSELENENAEVFYKTKK